MKIDFNSTLENLMTSVVAKEDADTNSKPKDTGVFTLEADLIVGCEDIWEDDINDASHFMEKSVEGLLDVAILLNSSDEQSEEAIADNVKKIMTKIRQVIVNFIKRLTIYMKDKRMMNMFKFAFENLDVIKNDTTTMIKFQYTPKEDFSELIPTAYDTVITHANNGNPYGFDRIVDDVFDGPGELSLSEAWDRIVVGETEELKMGAIYAGKEFMKNILKAVKSFDGIDHAVINDITTASINVNIEVMKLYNVLLTTAHKSVKSGDK